MPFDCCLLVLEFVGCLVRSLVKVSLFAFYCLLQVLKYLPKDIVNLVLSVYFSFVGGVSVASLIEPATVPLGVLVFGNGPQRKYGRTFELPFLGQVSMVFTSLQLLCLAAAFPISALYFQTRFWLLNNLLGIAFAVQGIESVSLGSFKIGAILLCGLFFYDIFWVFGTNKLLKGDSVMVTVAKGIDGPIKLLFPRPANMTAVAEANLAAAAANATSSTKPLSTTFFGEAVQFSMLGLGDIVVPGFLIALLLRFDAERAKTKPSHGAHGRFPKPYFHAIMVAYVGGLLTTVIVMERFKAAQPALLYLVPACLGAALCTALVRGELKLLFAYDEETKASPIVGGVTVPTSSTEAQDKKSK